MGWGWKEEKTCKLYKTRRIFWLYENSYVLTDIISIFSFYNNGMVELYRTIVSWITYTFEQWFWKDAEIQKPIKDNEEDEEILGIWEKI